MDILIFYFLFYFPDLASAPHPGLESDSALAEEHKTNSSSKRVRRIMSVNTSTSRAGSSTWTKRNRREKRGKGIKRLLHHLDPLKQLLRHFQLSQTDRQFFSSTFLDQSSPSQEREDYTLLCTHDYYRVLLIINSGTKYIFSSFTEINEN